MVAESLCGFCCTFCRLPRGRGRDWVTFGARSAEAVKLRAEVKVGAEAVNDVLRRQKPAKILFRMLF